mmetsp:Transcript_31627/g.65158  ORF Transcript_31627/g.65158 Transcript_31627/m.65158 type:complete len:95 (+) Transcript_31627:307-591(+)
MAARPPMDMSMEKSFQHAEFREEKLCSGELVKELSSAAVASAVEEFVFDSKNSSRGGKFTRFGDRKGLVRSLLFMVEKGVFSSRIAAAEVYPAA